MRGPGLQGSHFRSPPTLALNGGLAVRGRMAQTESTLIVKTVVGSGDHAILLEPRGHSIRLKPRGRSELWVPLDVAPALAAALAQMSANAARARV